MSLGCYYALLKKLKGQGCLDFYFNRIPVEKLRRMDSGMHNYPQGDQTSVVCGLEMLHGQTKMVDVCMEKKAWL